MTYESRVISGACRDTQSQPLAEIENEGDIEERRSETERQRERDRRDREERDRERRGTERETDRGLGFATSHYIGSISINCHFS
tara:strand:- start:7 stop:258 length:252 start_codon:yes stop_codon:yes gene_type:complete